MSDDHPPSSPIGVGGVGLELCVLGSGSAGNLSMVAIPGAPSSGGGVLLVDAGLGPRVFGKRLAALPAPASGRRFGLDAIRAVCLTHLDSDHFNLNWLATLRRHDVPVYCHASRVDELRGRAEARGEPIDVRGFDDDAAFEPARGVTLAPVAFAHDQAGSHGFVIRGHGARIGYATDLGRVPDALLEHFCELDLLAVESNYDRQMQMDSPRPWFLKQRITGGRGHLSNAEAYALVRELFTRCERAGRRLPRHVVLLHRSRDCNCPDLVRRLFARDARIASRLVLSEQDEPTPWLRAGPRAGEQLMLGWG